MTNRNLSVYVLFKGDASQAKSAAAEAKGAITGVTAETQGSAAATAQQTTAIERNTAARRRDAAAAREVAQAEKQARATAIAAATGIGGPSLSGMAAGMPHAPRTLGAAAATSPGRNVRVLAAHEQRNLMFQQLDVV